MANPIDFPEANADAIPNPDGPGMIIKRRKAILIITVMGKTAFDYHSSQRYEISTDLNQDELGEYIAIEISKAWKTGLDPAKDGLTVTLQFA